jgi:hypothetical protein
MTNTKPITATHFWQTFMGKAFRSQAIEILIWGGLGLSLCSWYLGNDESNELISKAVDDSFSAGLWNWLGMVALSVGLFDLLLFDSLRKFKAAQEVIRFVRKVADKLFQTMLDMFSLMLGVLAPLLYFALAEHPDWKLKVGYVLITISAIGLYTYLVAIAYARSEDSLREKFVKKVKIKHRVAMYALGAVIIGWSWIGIIG